MSGSLTGSTSFGNVISYLQQLQAQQQQNATQRAMAASNFQAPAAPTMQPMQSIQQPHVQQAQGGGDPQRWCPKPWGPRPGRCRLHGQRWHRWCRWHPWGPARRQWPARHDRDRAGPRVRCQPIHEPLRHDRQRHGPNRRLQRAGGWRRLNNGISVSIISEIKDHIEGAQTLRTPASPPKEIDGIPVSYLDRVAMIESGNNPHAKAPTSSATGLYQFTDGTWASICKQAPQLHLTADGRMDRDQSTRAMCWLANADGLIFRKFTMRDPQDYERYLMHFLGGPRGTQVCNTPRDKSLVEAFGPEAYHAVSSANRFLTGWNAGQLQDWSKKKFA